MILITPFCVLLQKLSEGTVVVLHACAHNPTGVDPNVSVDICNSSLSVCIKKLGK